jgi:hypothetical protein
MNVLLVQNITIHFIEELNYEVKKGYKKVRDTLIHR